MIECKITTCLYNERGVCHMYNDERTDKQRTIEFYEKWNPKRLAPAPKSVTRQEGDMF